MFCLLISQFIKFVIETGRKEFAEFKYQSQKNKL